MLEEKLKNYLLNDVEALYNVVRELNGWNGCLDWLDFEPNDEEFFDIFFDGKNGLEIARAISFGDYNYNDEWVKFNGYGNLVSYSDYEMKGELKDSIDDIIKNLINEHNDLYLSDDIEEIFRESDDEDDEDDEVNPMNFNSVEELRAYYNNKEN